MKYVYLSALLLLTACAFQSQTARRLMGLSLADVRRQMGKPVIERTEGLNTIWAYRQDACTTLVYFDATNTVQFVDFSGNCPMN